jgi:2-amino-4-hydroxy-6-hydroxymethyldihydropteridine diphosphokinase
VGNRREHLRHALREIEGIARLSGLSSLYETAPEGYADQRSFLNAVAEVRTPLPAPALLRAMKAIERRGGRVPTFRNGPRTIDIDLLDVRGECHASPELTLPHPRMHRRRFVLEPLAEIAPRWRHPRLKSTARQLLERL